MLPSCPTTLPTDLYSAESLCPTCDVKLLSSCTHTSVYTHLILNVYQMLPLKCFLCSLHFCTKVMSCLPTFLQSGQDCFLLACVAGHEDIVRELLTKEKVDQNVVNNVRKYPVHYLFFHYVIVCVPHLQDGCGAVHLACGGGHVQLVKTLVEEFGMTPDVNDKVSILSVHDLS